MESLPPEHAGGTPISALITRRHAPPGQSQARARFEATYPLHFLYCPPLYNSLRFEINLQLDQNPLSCCRSFAPPVPSLFIRCRYIGGPR